MFVVTSVATLRERTSGTLERLLTTPLGKGDLMLGYALAFGLWRCCRPWWRRGSRCGCAGSTSRGRSWLLVVVAVFDALLGTALGLLASGFARTEFQAVQFLPAFVLPQFLLCGLLVPRDQLPAVLEAISDVLPLSYAVDAMKDVTVQADPLADVLPSLGVIALWIVVLAGPGQPDPAPPHPLTSERHCDARADDAARRTASGLVAESGKALHDSGVSPVRTEYGPDSAKCS